MDIKNILTEKNKRNVIIIVFSILATILFCYPYLNSLTISGHDADYHLTRIQQIANELMEGNFPVLIHSKLADGLGYANSIFYPDLFLYLPAILNILGINIINAYKIFIIVLTYLTFMITYITTKKIFKSTNIALIASCLYTFSLYRIVDVYTRAALGEIITFVFIPLIILGCYELCIGQEKKWYILPIGIFGVANSHIITLAIMIGVIFYFIIINLNTIIKEKSRIKYILLSGVLSILIISSVYAPMIEQIMNGEYKVVAGGTSEDLSTKALQISHVFQNEYTNGIAEKENINMKGQMNFGIGILLLVLPILVLVTDFKDKKEKKFIIQLLILGICGVIATTRIFPWKYFTFLNVIQLPWRINSIITMSLALVSAYSFYYFISNNKKEFTLLLLIIIVLVTSNYLDNIDYSTELAKDSEFKMIAQGEYLPKNGYNLEDAYVYNIEDKNITYDFEKINNQITFYIDDSNTAQYINVPIIYYTGYTAVIEEEGKSEKLELMQNLENGLTTLENEERLTGKVTIKYEMTIVQKISYAISYAVLISISIYWIVIKTKKKDRK